MKIYISFFFCLAIYFVRSFAYAAVPVVDDGHSCVIVSPARCPKTCDCKNYITFNPKSWYRAFLASVKGKRCKCESCSQKARKVKCKNGVCDKKNQKCVCDYCWVGEVCDKFKNKHAPEFEDSQQVVTIPISHPPHLPVTRVAAFDRDLQFCNGASCPCGEIVYKLRKDFGVFKIDKYSGAISITRTPDASEYLLMVTATNMPDIETTKEGNINVTIKVSDTVPMEESEPEFTPQAISYDEAEHEEENFAHGGDVSHVRMRRSADPQADHPLVVTAVPQLSTTYYFNKNEKIVFQVKVMNNGTSTIENVEVKISSVWLNLENLNVTVGPSENRFDNSGTKVVDGRQIATFSSNIVGTVKKFKMAEITGVVKEGVTPLANINLDLNVTYMLVNTGQKIFNGIKSSPIVYGVFPEVNVTTHTITAATYDDIDINMKMQLPLLNYRLLVELTTNVECFVFMEVKKVVVATGHGITFTGTKNPVYHKSDKSNGLNDRAVIDFGNITVSGAEEDRAISINYKLAVKDHANVANGSTHFSGTGLQAGPGILWVEQQQFQITKIEPALEVSYNKSAIDNSSRLFVGDEVNIEYRVDHTSTSEELAKTVKVSLISPHLEFQQGAVGTKENETHYSMQIQESLNKGKILTGVFKMVVRDTVSPLLSVPALLFVEYENQRSIKKFPLQLNVTLPLIGTPSFTFNRVDGSGDITFGSIVEFELVILLTKMNSSLQIEFVLPKYGNDNESSNGTALMHILSFDIVSIGNNIKEATNINKKTVSTTPKLFATSDDKRWKDQAVWDLGIVLNKGSDVSNTSDNQIKLKLRALVNEVQNVTTGTTFKVGAGVIGMPRMVWVGQLDAKVLIRPERQPKMNFLHSVVDATKDIYEHEISFNHSAESDQFAYNVTFEYFLPPYVEFVKELKTSPKIQRVNVAGNRARFTLTEPLTFLDSANHSIQVQLKRSLSPKTGEFDFMVPCALTYVNYEHKRWQYWRSVTRGIHVRSRAPTIRKKSNAHANYYGRGMYLNSAQNEIYVCMNMHLPSSRPACYMSTDNGDSWMAMDSRVGCVMGHHGNELYAIGRNQVIVIKYNEADKDWYLLNEEQKQALSTALGTSLKTYKDFSGVTTLEPEEIQSQHMDSSELWGVTDEGVYYRPDKMTAWAKKAKWRL